MTHKNLAVRGWRDYELIDSGDNRKLERFGKYILIRPETQALWRPAHPAEWKQPNAEFRFEDGKGTWSNKKSVPEEWELGWGDAKFIVHLGSFKHLGVFPEQAANWEWIAERVMHAEQARKSRPRVLNLFGYTGIASIIAAHAGAHVTHIDASRQSNEWAKENARLSEIPMETVVQDQAKDGSAESGGIRFLFDDALKFVEREARRGAEYDGIILDPPAFGRGPKGEVWHIEEDLPRLLDSLAKIFNKKPGSFFLLNGYAAGYSPQSLRQAMRSAFPEAEKVSQSEFGELQINGSNPAGPNGDSHLIPSGIYVRFVR